MKKLTKILSFFIASILIIVLSTNYLIKKNALNKTYDLVTSIPKNKVELILGTSKNLKNGNVNLYYKYRLEAAIKLYNAGKIDFILISGDNSSKDYDEPSEFKNDLIKKGIPEYKIYLDYAGFRTLDSVIRAKEIFSLSNITFISQKFHNERAIFIANQNNINAIGFNARDVNLNYGFKTHTREYLARTKASIDILFNVQPKFLGEKIIIK